MHILLVLHIIAIVLWIGSLVVQSVLFIQGSKSQALKFEQVKLQSLILRNVGVPGLIVTFITGVLLILYNGFEFLASPWLLYKLIFVLLILTVDYVVLRKIFSVKRTREGNVEISKNIGVILFAGTLIFLFGVLYFAIGKTF